MIRYWVYLKYVLRHKWFVFWEGIKLDVPLWRLIVHDWDKFLPFMFFSYAHNFFDKDGTSQYKGSSGFMLGWLAHQNLNDHHWQWWVILKGRGGIEALPMTDVSRREMLADWRGTGRAITGGDTIKWYKENKDFMIIHPVTRAWIENQLGYSDDN